MLLTDLVDKIVLAIRGQMPIHLFYNDFCHSSSSPSFPPPSARFFFFLQCQVSTVISSCSTLTCSNLGKQCSVSSFFLEQSCLVVDNIAKFMGTNLYADDVIFYSHKTEESEFTPKR